MSYHNTHTRGLIITSDRNPLVSEHVRAFIDGCDDIDDIDNHLYDCTCPTCRPDFSHDRLDT